MSAEAVVSKGLVIIDSGAGHLETLGELVLFKLRGYLFALIETSLVNLFLSTTYRLFYM